MEFGILLILAGAGYAFMKQKGGRRKALLSRGALNTDAVNAEMGDRPSMTDAYHSTYTRDVRADEFKRGSNMMAQSSLSGKTMDMTHNNMVPFFKGSAPTQYNEKEGARFASQLEMFTGGTNNNPGSAGMISLGNGKRERGPMFLSEHNESSTHMVDKVRDAYMNNIQLPRNRANEKPFESVVVGRPGIKGGETGDVYYDMRASTLPPTIEEMRTVTNPRETFEGRIISGSLSTATKRQDLPLVEQNRQILLREQTTTDDMLRTTGGVTKRSLRPKWDIKATERQMTSRAYSGIATKPAAKSSMVRVPENGYGVIFRTPLAPFSTGPAVSKVKEVDDYGKSNVLVYGNERDITGTRSYQGGLVSAVKAIIAPISDMLRVTRKEEVMDAPRPEGGNVMGMVSKLTVYDAQDITRTTRKELDVDAPRSAGGNVVGKVSKLTVYDKNDIFRTTRKELDVDAPRSAGGNVVGEVPKLTVYDKNDIFRTTRKELDVDAPRSAGGNIVGEVPKLTVYDKNDIFRTTRKELDVDAPRSAGGNVVGEVPKLTVYDKNDIFRTTRKELDVDAPRSAGGNIVGKVSKLTVYDEHDIARTTRKELDVDAPRSAGGNVVGEVPKLTVYDSQNIAKTTRKETNIHDTFGGSGMRPTHTFRGQVVDPDAAQARTTIRETLDNESTERNLFQNKASAVFDADSWRPGVTVKETTAVNQSITAQGISGGLQRTRAGAYTVASLDPARVTQKSTLVDTGTVYGGIALDSTHTGAYTTTMTDPVKETMRHILSDNEYYGTQAGGGANMVASSHEAANNARPFLDREVLEADDRDFLGSSVKVAASQGALGESTVELNPLRDADWNNAYLVPDSQAKALPTAHASHGNPPTCAMQREEGNRRMGVEVQATNLQNAGNPYALDIRRT